MNIYQLLNDILEALGDGRKPDETQAQFKTRKANELLKHFNDKEDAATAEADKISAKADEAGEKFKKTNSLNDFVEASNLYSDAQGKRSEASRAQNKGWEVYKIKHGMNKGLKEAMEIIESIHDEVEKRRLAVAHADHINDKEDFVKKVKDYDKVKNAYAQAHGNELEQAQAKAGGSKESTFYGMKRLNKVRNKTKNSEGEAATRERRANSRQIKKAIFRHHKKSMGEPELKPYSDPTLKYYNKFSGDLGQLGIEFHNKPEQDKIEASKRRHKEKMAKMTKNEALEIMEAILNAIDEGRREGESNQDFKNRLHKELVLNIDKKAEEARNKAVEASKKYAETGKGKEEAIAASEKHAKLHNKLDKLDDIQPVYNAYVRAEQDKPEDANKVEMTNQKSIRRNAEKNAKTHAHNAHKLELRSIKASEAGKERAADNLYDKANAEWDKETREQDRAAQAHHKVEELKHGKADEALALIEAIVDYADNLFELDYEEKQNISPNKIKRVKKDKDGEKVEVVSVADELFPYEGNEKQQFNQKVLAKINDMIEGSGSLEDLIQFVRTGSKVKKVANEGYEEALGLLESSLRNLSITRELRGRQGIYNQHSDNYEKNMNRAKTATGHRQEVLLQNAKDADKQATEANKKLRRTKGEILDGLRKRGATNPQAHEIVNQMLESIEGLFTNENKNIFGKETSQGSLEDDISKTVTGKTLNQHIENGVKKVITPVPKKVTTHTSDEIKE